MPLPLGTSTLLAFIALLSFVVWVARKDDHNKEAEFVMFVSLLTSILSATCSFLGFMLFCNIIPIKEEVKIVQPSEIIVGKNMVCAFDFNGKVVSSVNASLVNNPDKKKIVIAVISKINSYGNAINQPLVELRLEEDNKSKGDL